VDIVDHVVRGEGLDDWVEDEIRDNLPDIDAAASDITATHGAADPGLAAGLDAGTRESLDMMGAFNERGAALTDAMHAVGRGEDLTDAQVAEVSRISRTAGAWSNALGILTQADDIAHGVARDHYDDLWNEHARRELQDAQRQVDRAEQIESEAEYLRKTGRTPPGGLTDPHTDPRNTGYVE
jgi:hypothetical protein